MRGSSWVTLLLSNTVRELRASIVRRSPRRSAPYLFPAACDQPGAMYIHRRSMAACERSGKRPPPGAQSHALARAALATWLSPSSKTSSSSNGTAVAAASPGSTSPAPSSTIPPPDASQRRRLQPQRQEARRDYLRHCLARSAIAARAVGRAAKKATAAAATSGAAAAGENTVSAPPAAGAPPPAVGEEESLCRFLVGEVDRVVAEAEAEHRDGGAAAAASAATPAPLAQHLLGLGPANQPDPPTTAAPAAHAGAVDAFLTAVLKHRLADAASLRAVRAVACTLFRRQEPPKRCRDSDRPQEAIGSEVDGGQEEEEGGEGEEGHNGNGDDDGDRSAAATVKEVGVRLPVLPGWSAATMLER